LILFDTNYIIALLNVQPISNGMLTLQCQVRSKNEKMKVKYLDISQYGAKLDYY